MLYTVLLVAICLMMALLLFRSGRPTGGLDEADCEDRALCYFVRS